MVLSPPSEQVDPLRGSAKRSVLREGNCFSYLATAADIVCVASSPDHSNQRSILPVVLIGSEGLPSMVVCRTVGI